MDVLGALVFAFVCVLTSTLGEQTGGDPNSKTVILGISAICYDPKDVCNFQPCQNGARCSVPDDDTQPYKCHCFLGFGGVNCENRLVSLEVVKTEPREVQLSIRKSDDAHWAGYITELANLRTLRSFESRWIVEPGGVTEVTLPRLEPGTPYSVQVRPVKDFREPQIWMDEATFETPVELKIIAIHETRAVLAVVTSDSTELSDYTVKRTNHRNKTTVPFRQGVQPGNATKITLAPLDPDTKYHVRVTPVQEGKELEQRANEIHFRTLSDYSLHFPKRDTTDYVLMEQGLPSLGAITACVWIRSSYKLKGDELMAFFSYATYGTSDQYNEFLFEQRNGQLSIWLRERKYVQATANDGQWHHLCFTWENSKGSWNVYKDGARVGGNNTGFQIGLKVAAGGRLILGQEQDNVGGSFDRNQSFRGDLSGANVWNHALTAQEISDLSKSCLAGEGNVFRWSDFRSHTHGDVAVIKPSRCQA